METIPVPVDGAWRLDVACGSEERCFVATGAGCWEVTDTGAEPISLLDPGDCLGVVQTGSGVTGLFLTGRDRLSVLRLDQAGEAAIELRMTSRDGAPLAGLGFAAQAPDGAVWIAPIVDSGTDFRPEGVALIDLELGAIAFHRAGVGSGHGVLPVPPDVTDVAFDGERIVFATSSGLTILDGREVTVYTEATGLHSELLRAVVVTEGGYIFTGSGAGVETFDGADFTLTPLPDAVNDLALAADGQLWIASGERVARYDGTDLHWLPDLDRGQVLDLVIDGRGRVWARTDAALVRIAPSPPPRP